MTTLNYKINNGMPHTLAG